MKIWVTGAAGMLGSEVVVALQDANLSVAASDREVDITDAGAISCYLDQKGHPDWIVNCAAWTAVDQAETHEAAAFALNAEGPALLADAAKRCDARMIHLSTDYVFNGKAKEPYLPDSPVAPCSVYGKSKLAGEVAVREGLAAHVIIRTAWLYGRNGPNFVATMLRLMRERDEIGVVADQHGAPTYAADLAAGICRVVLAPSALAGTWHYTNRGQTTWFAFAQAIQEMGIDAGLLDYKCRIQPLATSQYPTSAARPMYSVLDTTSFEKDWDISIPHWRDSLNVYMQAIRGKYEV